MSRKRQHGTASSPITFSSKYAFELREMRRRGINMSDFIDKCIRLGLENGTNFNQKWPEYETICLAITAAFHIDAEAWIMNKAFALSRQYDSPFRDWDIWKPNVGDDEE